MVECLYIVLSLARLLTQREYTVASRVSLVQTYKRTGPTDLCDAMFEVSYESHELLHIFFQEKMNEYFYSGVFEYHTGLPDIENSDSR